MKTLLLIIILALTVSLQGQVVSFSYSPQNNDVGAIYISDEILKPMDLTFPIHLYTSFEYANYKLVGTRLYKFGIGPSFALDGDGDILFNLVSSMNFFKVTPIKVFKPVTIELGFTAKWPTRNIWLTTMIDILPFTKEMSEYTNFHFKFGVGYKF